MFKTIALTAAAGALIATTAPAIAGPGLVFQGTNLNGIKLQGVSTESVALPATTQPQLPPAPKLPAFDAELAGKPMQTACGGVCGGIRFNGKFLNGLKWNGIKWNGWSLNGRFSNGVKLNGKLFNGTTSGEPAMAERDASFNVRAVTLPGGKCIVAR